LKETNPDGKKVEEWFEGEIDFAKKRTGRQQREFGLEANSPPGPMKRYKKSPNSKKEHEKKRDGH